MSSLTNAAASWLPGSGALTDAQSLRSCLMASPSWLCRPRPIAFLKCVQCCLYVNRNVRHIHELRQSQCVAEDRLNGFPDLIVFPLVHFIALLSAALPGSACPPVPCCTSASQTDIALSHFGKGEFA